MSEMQGVYREHKWWKLNLSWKVLSVWIICRVLMALVRIFIINIRGLCESGIIPFQSIGLHWGNIFEGCKMETNWDLHTLLVRAESGPCFSFCFSFLLCSYLHAFIENSLFSSSGLLDLHVGAHVWLVTTSLSTKTNTTTNKARELAGMQDQGNPKLCNPQTFKEVMGWDRGVLRCKELGPMTPEEGTWSQES